MTSSTISVNVVHDRAVVALRGEHEAYTADKLARHVTALLDEGAAIAVDLREAMFIDSTVVGVLVAAGRRAREAGLGFQLLLGAETGWPVRRVLEVTGLHSVLDVVD